MDCQQPTPEPGPEIRDVDGADLQAGDTLLTGSGPHTIDHFEPYPGRWFGADGELARRACCTDGTRCTVAGREHFHVQGGAP